ncbi:MAG: (Fe-S)-binding protein [Acidobacteria bacterium]|nr:(Fe-S)-binding protein [Acidobacteriota bacterium]
MYALMLITTPTREVLWNISHVEVLYLLFALSLAVAAYGVWRRVQTWRQGLPVDRFDRPKERLQLLLKHALGQQRTLRERHARIFHTFIFTGFIILTIATTVVMVHHDFGLPLMQGWFYLIFQSFIVDVFGALTLFGVGLALWRRLKLKPKKLVYTDEAETILLALLAIVLTGFLVEGWRIAATHDPWGAWSPFGYVIARASAVILNETLLQHWHFAAWWTHAILVFGFIAWAPYTKMIHALTGPLNIYTARLAPSGALLKTIDFEQAETLGVKTLAGFTWKDLADFDACTECGRCTSVCPAHAAGKTLSPRDIILDLRTLLHEQSPISHLPSPIIGTVPATAPEALWACTTCGACMEACPVFIEQMPKIVDMRRFLVMEEAEFPHTMQDAITSLESRGHPFKGTQAGRLDWAEGLNVEMIGDAADAEVLLWVGCGGALLERNQKVVRATAQLLKKAGVKFAILGREENCTGDPARRIGNEFLFEMLAKENVETLAKYQVKKIVTSCPHCFNTFRNEYPHFGGHYEVFHHSEFLAALVNDGKLTPTAATDKQVTFHDPCYLGRHNGVFDAPRQLVQLSSKRAPVEPEMNRANGFCCGGGGGMSFVDEPKDKRVNQERAQQLLDTGADVVAVGCPFCMTMLEDGVKARKGEREVQVVDVAELLWQSVQQK